MREFFLSLIKLGIGTAKVAPMPKQIDWDMIEDLAARQGLSAVLIDGVEKLLEDNRPPKEVLLQWIGEVLQGYEYRYELYRRAIAEMAGFYNQHGYKMMVLKGYACSIDWPKPEHRPCGDIDIWLFGRQREADAIIAREKGYKIDNSHHHHSVFCWHDFSVENHYDFINVHHHKSHVALEKTLKELAQDDSHFVELYGETVYLPSPNLHALFLIKHAALHFVGTELTFRQLLDWAFFMQKHGKDVDWNWLLGILDENGLLPFFQIINAICEEDLGFEHTIFPTMSFHPMLKEKVLNDIFSYTYHEDASSNFIKRQIKRFNRWKANEWKHELCYKESMWSAFWSGVWSHLLKPSSI